jgi:heme exporter protein A
VDPAAEAFHPSTSSTGVSARGVARRFGPRWVLAGVDVELPRGGALLVTGANGSGKTTLLRCLATAIRPHAGGITLFGSDAWTDRAALRPRVALLSHPTRLYEDLSARENLATWARLGGHSADLDGLLQRVGLPTDRRDPVRAFSAGMRRRAALALLWLKRPALALLDEPFAALDPTGRELVSGMLRELRAGGATLVIATHLPRIAGPHCDAAIHLDAGRVTWRGLPGDAPAVESA